MGEKFAEESIKGMQFYVKVSDAWRLKEWEKTYSLY